MSSRRKCRSGLPSVTLGRKPSTCAQIRRHLGPDAVVLDRVGMRRSPGCLNDVQQPNFQERFPHHSGKPGTPYKNVLYCAILYYTILYRTILYYPVLYCAVYCLPNPVCYIIFTILAGALACPGGCENFEPRTCASQAGVAKPFDRAFRVQLGAV